jgi:hypothetical protein
MWGIRSKTSAIIVLLLVARPVSGQVVPSGAGRYLVTSAPLSLSASGPGLCVGVDPTDPTGIWWWEPGRSGCSSRSTGPDVFSAYDGAITVDSDQTTIEVRFKIGQHVGPPRDVRLTIRNGRIFVTGSDVPDAGADVGVSVKRMDDLVPPVVSLTHSGSAQAAINARQQWGPVVNGLRMAIAQAGPGPLPKQDTQFDVMFQNVGNTDVVLELGIREFGGRDGEARAPYPVRLNLIDPRGNSTELHFNDGPQPIVTRGVEDFTAQLPAGATHVLRLNLEQYGAALTGGRYRITSEFEGVGPQRHSQTAATDPRFWIGTLESGPIDFDVAP